jgi:hypothetical protein
MHTYQVTWFGEGADERVDVCTVAFDPAIIPSDEAEVEIMAAICTGLETTSTYGSYRCRRQGD